MSDDQYKDDEYHYPDSAGETYEAVTSEAEGAHQFNSPLDALRPILENRRLMISMGIGFVVFILLQVMVFVKGKKPEAPAKAHVKHTEVAHVESATPHEIPVLVKPKVDHQALPTSPVSHQANDAQVSDIKRQTEAHQGAIKNIQMKIGQVDQQLEALGNSSDTISERLAAVNMQLAELVKAEKARKAKAAAEKERLRPKKIYHLRAAVDGRAWIEDQVGHTRTVKTGDTIQDYGVVETISPASGIITTDSGRIIRFVEHVN